MAIVNIDIPDQLKQRLDAEAKRDMRSQRSTVILALEAYLTDREQASAASAKLVATPGEDGTPDGAK